MTLSTRTKHGDQSMTTRNHTYILLAIIVILFISYVLAYSKNLDCLKELEKHRHDREEVTRIEKWIERQNPRIPSATRRGYAEFTVDSGWPVLEDAKR